MLCSSFTVSPQTQFYRRWTNKIDKAPKLLCAFKKVKEQGFYKHITHCTIKHLNNLIEQDYRHMKRRFAKSTGFQSLRQASRTLKGIEIVQALYKRDRNLNPDFGFSTHDELLTL